MSNFLGLKPLNLLNSLVIGLVLTAPGVWGLSPAIATTLTKTQLEAASQILCQALEAGQSPEAARDAATAYLIEQVEDEKQLSPNTVRRQLRPVVSKQCPDQARKLKNL